MYSQEQFYQHQQNDAGDAENSRHQRVQRVDAQCEVEEAAEEVEHEQHHDADGHIQQQLHKPPQRRFQQLQQQPDQQSADHKDQKCEGGKHGVLLKEKRFYIFHGVVVAGAQGADLKDAGVHHALVRHAVKAGIGLAQRAANVAQLAQRLFVVALLLLAQLGFFGHGKSLSYVHIFYSHAADFNQKSEKLSRISPA